MRYVIVSVIKGDAGKFNNTLRKDVFNRFGAKSSKLPAHFTIKTPFEYNDSIVELEELLDKFSLENKKAPLRINSYGNFGERVIYMKVYMSDEGKKIHDKLIEEMENIPFLNFDEKDGKDKIFHITIASKKITKIFHDIWNYVQNYPCDFENEFNNISIFKWENNNWILHKEFLLQ